ncbi:MAG: GNAT family N-acetyltransferase [Pseudomonadota bacterium]
MTTEAIAIRTATKGDAVALAAVHDAAWRFAYRGILPGTDLERMIARRGPRWWGRALARPIPAIVVDDGGTVRGYATYGANRIRTLPHAGEIYELYLQPEYIGAGLGRRMVSAIRHRFAARGHSSFLVWSLEENTGGCAFYEKLGGRVVATSREPFGRVEVQKLAFAFGTKPAHRSGLRP